MTHMSNAISFRLGYSLHWISSWSAEKELYKKYLQEDFIIFRFIKLFFLQYSIPIFTSIKNRKKREEKNNKISGLKNLLSNQFIDLTFIFSNVRVSRAYFLGIFIYLFDTFLENTRLAFIKALKNTSLTFFKPRNQPRRKPITFTDLKFFSKLFRKTRKHRRKYKQRFSNSFLFARWYRRNRRQKLRIYVRRVYSHRRSFRLADLLRARIQFTAPNIIRHIPKLKSVKKLAILKCFPYLIYNIPNYNNLSYRTHLNLKNRFKLLKICLRIFQQEIHSLKQNLFFIVLLKNLLLSILLCPGFVPPFIFFKLLNSLILKEFSFKHLNFFYFKNIYQQRYLVYHSAGSAIHLSLKAFDKNTKVKISFFGMHVRNISASFITNYIIIKLGQYIMIHDILRPFLRSLKHTSLFLGFRIVVAGRLTRKERAAYIVRQYGDVTLGTKSCKIDYAADSRIMRFGVVGCKTLFTLKTKRSYYYQFTFTFIQVNQIN